MPIPFDLTAYLLDGAEAVPKVLSFHSLQTTVRPGYTPIGS
jgi:hypothetical protein